MKTLILLSIALFGINSFVFSQQWIQTAGTPEGGGITDMVVTSNGTVVVTCANYNYPSGQLGGVRHSTNGGATWVNDFQHYTARTLALGQNDLIFASSWNYPTTTEGLYVSTNQGVTWTTYRYLVGANNNIFSILVRDNNQTVYIGTRTGVLKSTNGGYNFTQINNGIPANSWVRDLVEKSNGNIYAATTNGVFKSSNSGSSWQQLNGLASGDTAVKLCVYENPADGNQEEVIAGTSKGKLYEEGANAFLTVFFQAVSGDVEMGSLDGFGTEIMIGHYSKEGIPGNSYVARSLSPGWQVQQTNEGLPGNRPISVVAVNPVTRTDNASNVEIYLGYYEGTSTGAKIFKRTFPIGIQQISNEVPDAFSLSQNYPNPFNPMTKIKFDIHKASNVNITVFDVLGRHITTLVNEKLGAGTYETEWNANNMPGGVYFYRIEADDFSETKKMILVK